MAAELTTRSVQFLSRPFSQSDQDVSWTGKTAQGRDITLSGTLRIGTPLLYGARASFGQRPLFAPPWPESPSIGAVQYVAVDPYTEERWPSYILLEARLNLPNESYSVELAQDVAQYLRGIVSWGLFNPSPFAFPQDQRVKSPGYRWGYWTPMLDFVGNPSPTPYGGYAYSEQDEAVGPGFVAVKNMGFPLVIPEVQMGTGGSPDISLVKDYLAQLFLALVWSQAISLPNRTNVQTDQKRIAKRIQDRKHKNAYGELKDAERHLDQNDLKGTVRSAAASVEAALRFYCDEWEVPFPSRNHIPFNDQIEQILTAANRPSYKSVNPNGSIALLHIYRARSSMHEGDNYFKNKLTGDIVHVDRVIATELLHGAKSFRIWLDSQG